MEENKRTFNERILSAGITTIREVYDNKGNEIKDGKVYLEYDGKTIERPIVNDIEKICKKEFGLEI